MIKINQDNAEIKFAKNIYNSFKVLQAAKTFTEDCWIGVNEDKENIIIQIKPKNNQDLQKTADEFNNYVLFLTKGN